jgi:hypothetical protein
MLSFIFRKFIHICLLLKTGILLGILAVVLNSCLGTRYLQKDERLLVQDPKVKGVSNKNEENIQGLIRQKANSRLLGLPLAYLVPVYQYGLNKYDSAKYRDKMNRLTEKYNRKIDQAKSEKRKRKLQEKKTNKIDKVQEKLEEGNFWMRLGEPLAVFDSGIHLSSTEEISRYYYNIGYFENEVEVDFLPTDQNKMKVVYRVNPRVRYLIDSIIYDFPQYFIDSLMQEHQEDALIKPGMAYNQDVLSAERERIYKLMSNNGFFDFSRQFIQFTIDTASLNSPHSVLMKIMIKPPESGKHLRYQLDSVVFVGSSSVKEAITYQELKYNDVAYLFGLNKYSPKVLDWRMEIYPGQFYSREKVLDTQEV